VGGFYDVLDLQGQANRCRARGRFKKEIGDIMVGDRVEFEVPAGEDGIIERILPRKTLLKRPPVANIDQVIIVCSPQNPALSLQLIDRLLLLAESKMLEVVICMNKADLSTGTEEQLLHDVYGQAGYQLFSASASCGQGIEELRAILTDRISVLAGPSGVGKSSLLSLVQPGLALQTGEVSPKIGRGRHTTRHVQLFPLDGGGLVADTPGFSQLDLTGVKSENIPDYFPEFDAFAGQCRFKGCRHIKEPDCAVKSAVLSGHISATRHKSYLLFMDEVAAQERSY
jgi:ribosome biogenesis GTPase / thiamine phosphate phosphatase